MKKLAIVCIFFDGYEDLWYDFLNIKEMMWKDCPFHVYVVNDQKELKGDFGDITVLHAGKDAEFSKRVQVAVDNVEEDYFLILLEDYFFGKKVDTQKFIDLFNYISEQNLDYYTMPMPEFAGKKGPARLKVSDGVYKISKDREYLFSCMPSVWKKEFLKLCIGRENYNAWIFEGIYAKSDFLRDERFLDRCLIDHNNPLNLRHGALQGKLVPKTVRALNRAGYKFTTDRQKQPFKSVFIHQVKKFGHWVVRTFKLNFIAKMFKKKSVLNRFATEIAEVGPKVITKEKMEEYIKTR